jgi:solute carrier family 25 carnitine/acylcarnitine transporter 20/29
MSDSPSINDAETAQPKQQTTSAVKSFLSGAAGGVSCVLVGHPFDLTKTRLQTAARGEYTGAMDVVRRTLAQDGVKG